MDDHSYTKRRRLMMNTQFQVFHGGTFQMHWGQPSGIGATEQGVRRLTTGEALHLGRLGGDLTVVDGRVWLTRDGDRGDHFVEAGQKVRLAVDENAVIESARTGETITVRWTPRRQSFIGAVLAEPLRGVAFLAARAADGFAALARTAAQGAKHAQGCISGGGDRAVSLDSLK
jgi:Protein of unknown function (DUF2917)